MAPLTMKLPAIESDEARRPSPADLADVEVIAASIGFMPYRGQVRVDGRYGLRMLTKPDELGMIPITPGPTSQHSSRQKTFPPDGDKASCIEM